VPSEEKKMKTMLMTTTRQGVATGRKGGEWCNCPGRQSQKGDKMGSKTKILNEKKNALKNTGNYRAK
jgi:hypothetical protein